MDADPLIYGGTVYASAYRGKVAEYVETEEARSLITELGVTFAQGHAIGKPRPLAEVIAEMAAEEKISTG